MLFSLHIENIAVIKTLDLDFSRGFTALTGETGAGKSVLIDAVGLLLGERADKEMIRHGEKGAFVSGVFGSLSEAALAKAEEIGFPADEEGNLLISRTVGADGKSQIRVGAKPASLAVLRALAPLLLSIHGQTDTHALTEPRVHLELLDRYADTGAVAGEYRAAYTAFDGICREIETIAEKERERERLIEVLRYQIADIDALSLKDGEEEELVERKMKIKNSERITKHASFVYRALKGSEKGSVAFLLDRSIASLEQLSDVLPALVGYAEKLRDGLYEVEDIAEEVLAVLDDAEEDPDTALNDIESRLDKISKLKRKYGLTVADVLAFREKAAAELDTLENADERLRKLAEERKVAYERAASIAATLHDMRKSAARLLESSVRETLEYLDMPKVVFDVRLEEEIRDGEKVLYPDGSDKAEFFICPNRGAEPQPLSKIASGGELARVMLALKCAIAGKDGVGTVIFDEIDAGVSGKTARKIGMKLHELSANIQLLCVTHSAQIASLGDEHFLISKSDVDGKTETAVAKLDREGRIRELSRILGGITVTDAQKRAAVDMLNEREAL